MRTWRRRKNFAFLIFVLRVWCLSTAAENADSTVHNTQEGNSPDEPKQRGEASKPERYETTVPLLLKGNERRPLWQLASHPASLQLLVRAEGEQLILSLEKNEGLFASHYTETHYQEDGSAVTSPHNFTNNCYYHGEVQAHPNSDVTLSTCSGLRGFIALENKTFIIEPMSGHDNGAHFIYRVQELTLTPGDCGHGFNMSSVAPESHIKNPFQSFHTRHKRHAQKTTKYVELIIVADNREFQKQGRDVEKVKQRLAEIANYVDKFYRALDIRVALVGLEVWSDSDKCPITQDPFSTLHEFLDWRKVKLLPQKPHDNAQLISGVYFQGTTIGMAPIMSMCTAEQSGGIVMDHSENPLGAAVTLAHELGHNFGMNHDTPERGCGCRMTVDRGGCIMTPSTGGEEGRETQKREIEGKVRDKQEKDDNEGIIWLHVDVCDRHVCHEGWPQEICVITMRGNLRDRGEEQSCQRKCLSGHLMARLCIEYPFPTVFSTCSKKDLAASLEKGVGMCLYNMPEVKVLYGGQKCGNGYVEEGEECDCGEPEECMNPCCNATTCTLKGDAVCAHGQCCEDCRLKLAGTLCRESSNSCDLPEFCTGANPHCPANVYLHDGHTCHNVEGYCYNGICQTHEQQCITLWGAGAKPAPGICFERVNSAGDPYGNCGKDSKGSFAKCDA
ncbi:Disintegrin and metalloproteinase domain-containing protein 12, partial [Larimichthys crocea]